MYKSFEGENDLKKLVLFGAGGFGREVAASIVPFINKRTLTYELLGFIDDGPQYHEGITINGYPWLGNRNWILEHKDDVYCTCTVGAAKVKASIQRDLTEKGVRFETLIGERVYVAPFSEIGPGSVLYGGTAISVNCKIGTGVVLNDNVKVGHDVTIGDYTSVMPGTGISGGCVIGKEVDIGGHVYIIPGRKIGDSAKIAAGSVVFSNVKAGTTVLGNPAKRIRALE